MIFVSGDGSQSSLCARVHEDVPLDEAVQDEVKWSPSIKYKKHVVVGVHQSS